MKNLLVFILILTSASLFGQAKRLHNLPEGVSPETLEDSTSTVRTDLNDEIKSTETISQSSHPFSVGAPLWYSGDYLLARDTGTSVRVDGVVSAVPDANSFVIQRTGKFTLNGHGLPLQQQLYVQPDGSYSVADTANSLVYGWAINSDEIYIGVKPDQVRSIAAATTRLLGYRDVNEIESASIPLGYKVEDRSTGVSYFVKSEMPQYSEEGDYVISLRNGNYAVADLSKKREFQSFDEFDREAALLGFTGSAEYVTISGIRIKVTPTPDVIAGNPDNIDTTADGFYLKKFQTAFSGENILKTSRYYDPTSSATGWVIRPDEKFNYATSVSGLQEAMLLTGIDSTDSNTRTIFAYPVSGKAQVDSTYTYSFDIKYISGSGDLRYKVDLGDDVRINKDGEWHRSDNTFTLTNAAFVRIDFYGFAPGDSILFARPNLGKGGPTSYKPTTFGVAAESGTMYLNTGAALLEEKWLRLDKFGPPVASDNRLFGDQTALINDGLEFCQEGRIAKGVQLSEGVYHAKYISLPQGTGMRGVPTLQTGDDDLDYAQRGTVIFADEVPDNSHFLDVSLPDGETIRYNAVLKDLWIELRDSLTSGYDIVRIEESQSGIYENIMVTASDDSYAERAINMTVTLSSDQTKNIIDNIKIKGNGGDGDTTYNIDTAFVYEGSAGNFLNRLDLNRTKVGFVARGGTQCNVNTFLFAQTCETALLIENAQTVVHGLYTEGAGVNNGAGAIKITGTGRFDCYDCTMQSQSTTDTLWNITNGTSFTVYGGQIRTFGRTKTEGINAINFYNVGSTQPLDQLPITAAMSRRLTIKDNYNWATKEPYNNDFVSDYRQSEVMTTKSTFLDVVMGDTLTMSEVVLKGERVNLLGESEIFDSGSYISPGGTDTIKVVADTTLAPDGTKTAELITYQGNDIGAGSMAWCDFPMLDVFEEGDEFVFTMFVRPHQEMPLPARMEIRPYNNTGNEVEFDFRAEPGEWTRLPGIRGTIASTTGSNTMSLRFRNGLSSGDSLSVWGAYMKKGIHESTYIPTSTVGVNDTTLTLYVNNSGKLKIDGNIQVTGNVEGNFGGTATGTTDASGELTFSHGLGYTPEAVMIQNAGGAPGRTYDVISIDDTSVGVTIYNSGVSVVSEAYSIQWIASK